MYEELNSSESAGTQSELSQLETIDEPINNQNQTDNKIIAKMFMPADRAAIVSGIPKELIKDSLKRAQNPLPHIKLSRNRRYVCVSQIERFFMEEYGVGNYVEH